MVSDAARYMALDVALEYPNDSNSNSNIVKGLWIFHRVIRSRIHPRAPPMILEFGIYR